MMSWKRAIATLGPVAVLSLSACLASRERLDPPRVYLSLDDESVDPGTTLTGMISAADRSGLVYASASLIIGGDTLTRRSDRLDYIADDTLDFAFLLPIASTAPRGARIIVTATVIDNQLFTVTVEDTAHVR